MIDTRIIRRLAYDGNYQRAIELIVDIIDGKKNYFEVKEDLEKRRKASFTAKAEEFVKDFVKIQDDLFFENIPIEKLVLLRDRINAEIDKRRIEIFGKDRP